MIPVILTLSVTVASPLMFSIRGGIGWSACGWRDCPRFHRLVLPTGADKYFLRTVTGASVPGGLLLQYC